MLSKHNKDTLARLDNILKQQITDLENATQLANANFLAASGCMNTIEFLGGIRNGKLGEYGKAESRFKEGVRILGGEWTEFGEQNMWQIRCGLTHQYFPTIKEWSDVWITTKESAKKDGLPDNDEYLILEVSGLIGAIKEAWKRLRKELEQDDEMLEKAAQALAKLPDWI